jgi:hypothetical protein
LFTALLIGIERSRVVVGCTLFVTAVAMFAVPVLGRGTNAISVSEGEQNVFLRRLSGFMLASPGADAYSSVGLRFSVVPVLLVASAFAITISSKRRASRPTGTLLRALFVAHVAVLVVVGFSVSNPRSNGPGWHDELAHAAARDCANAPPDAPVRVETPMWLFPVEVTCDDLVGVEP